MSDTVLRNKLAGRYLWVMMHGGRTSMVNKACVLIFGHDPLLLGTRRMVLERGGFRVLPISHFSELRQFQAEDIQAFVLCHTLTPEDQQVVIAMIRRVSPFLKGIVMTAFTPEFSIGTGSHFLSPFDGPQALISAVSQTVRETDSIGYSYHGRDSHTVRISNFGTCEQPLEGWMFTGLLTESSREVTLATDPPATRMRQTKR